MAEKTEDDKQDATEAPFRAAAMLQRKPTDPLLPGNPISEYWAAIASQAAGKITVSPKG
jgi:hypothetical protein